MKICEFQEKAWIQAIAGGSRYLGEGGGGQPLESHHSLYCKSLQHHERCLPVAGRQTPLEAINLPGLYPFRLFSRPRTPELCVTISVRDRLPVFAPHIGGVLRLYPFWKRASSLGEKKNRLTRPGFSFLVEKRRGHFTGSRHEWAEGPLSTQVTNCPRPSKFRLLSLHAIFSFGTRHKQVTSLSNFRTKLHKMWC